MWTYYGSKANLVDLYPAPKFDKIIEPFAGTARYALKYYDREVLLVDKYEVIVKIWKWLQQCSKNDILSLPRFKPGQTLDQFTFNSEEEKLFVGFIIGSGGQSPRNKCADRMFVSRPNRYVYNLNRIANNLFKIKHWKIVHGSYQDVNNEEATWFIDPPYQFGGHVYIKSNKHIDFNILSDWCKERKGQVMVCENTKASWMDFKPLIKQKGSKFSTTEAIWTNFTTIYDNIQQTLF